MLLPQLMWFFHKQQHTFQDAVKMRSNINVGGGFVSSVFSVRSVPELLTPNATYHSACTKRKSRANDCLTYN